MLSSSEALTNNVAIGLGAGSAITTGDSNSLYGNSAGAAITQGFNNTAAGSNSSSQLTNAGNNSSFGAFSLYQLVNGNQNSAFGSNSFFYLQADSSRNTAVGCSAGAFRGGGGSTLDTASNSIYIGDTSRASGNGVVNEIVIGCDAIGGGSNTVTLGNTSTANTFIGGNLRLADAASIVIGTTTGTKIGTATTQKLAFYGDTPIVQPTTAVASATAVHGTGQAVKDDSTFGGYTIGQIVTALQTLGLLA
jgi:hypothetical protein